MLARLPAGTAAFLDTNIFLYHALGTHPSCTELLGRTQRGEVHGYTSPVVLSEVSHQLMLAEIGERYAVTPGGALKFLRRHPELIATLTKTRVVIQHIRRWRVRTLPLRWREVALAAELSQRHWLLTTDALILATMRTYHITHLISNDTDFTRVPNITLWRP